MFHNSLHAEKETRLLPLQSRLHGRTESHQSERIPTLRPRKHEENFLLHNIHERYGNFLARQLSQTRERVERAGVLAGATGRRGRARVINDNKNNDRNNWQYIFYPFYDQNESQWRVKLYPICFYFFPPFSAFSFYLICLSSFVSFSSFTSQSRCASLTFAFLGSGHGDDLVLKCFPCSRGFVEENFFHIAEDFVV
jgi:hypothetical protein